ncbi:MAG: hypothetical protein QOD84_1491, partial [Acidobacteriaceae bacterium]
PAEPHFWLPDYQDLMDDASAGAPRWTETRQIQDDEVLALLKKQNGGQIYSGDEMVLQQLRLRSAGTDSCQSFSYLFRRVSS